MNQELMIIIMVKKYFILDPVYTSPQTQLYRPEQSGNVKYLNIFRIYHQIMTYKVWLKGQIY